MGWNECHIYPSREERHDDSQTVKPRASSLLMSRINISPFIIFCLLVLKGPLKAQIEKRWENRKWFILISLKIIPIKMLKKHLKCAVYVSSMWNIQQVFTFLLASLDLHRALFFFCFWCCFFLNFNFRNDHQQRSATEDCIFKLSLLLWQKLLSSAINSHL